jgi:3-oxoacyl-[acyl-carrier protein] reductase
LADCEHLVAQTVEAFGRLDVLVNNAGIGVFAAVEALSVEDWRRQIATNLDGVFYCCRAALPHLKRNGGWIVNIGSLAGKNPFVGGAAYNATKFGLLGFSEALMLEVRHQGVRVVCVMPGSVASDFSGDAAAGSEWKLHPEDVAQVVGDLLAFPERALPSRVEIRPTRPPRKG